jgi:DmsE family decaheme c-type cytochrome
MDKTRGILFLFPLCLLLFSFSLSTGKEITTKEAEAKKGYIGAETCKDCHEKQYDSYAKSIHSKKSVKGPGLQEACETCHGPGAKHVEKGGGRDVDIFTFDKNVDPKERSAKCLVCHEETRQLTNWKMSKHHDEDIACDVCHTAHSQKGKLIKEDQSSLCYKCHQDIRSQANRQSHHPIKEGLIQCTSCHDPHGTFGAKQIKADTVNELCYKCHAEKRGPFMFEHPPVEENCLNCHTSHGSNHSKLLVLKAPQLCQACHDASGHSGAPLTADNTFAGNAPNNRMYARACMNCHSNIHGSNASSTRGRRFVR